MHGVEIPLLHVWQIEELLLKAIYLLYFPTGIFTEHPLLGLETG